MIPHTDEIRALAARSGLRITDAQVQAIVDRMTMLESGQSHATGLHHFELAAGPGNSGAVGAHLHYVRRGQVRDPALEVTVFATDGSVVESHDFG